MDKDQLAYDITRKVFDLLGDPASPPCSEVYVKRIVLGIIEQHEKLECNMVTAKNTVTKSADVIIAEIAEVLAEGGGEFIAEIANQVLTSHTEYLGDSLYKVEG